MVVQEQQQEAAVGASQDSGDPPFEEESLENQLPSLRAAVRKHAAKGGAPPFVPAQNVRLTPRPAVGGESADGDEGFKMHWEMFRDIGKYMTDEEKDLFGGYQVFRDSSPLWVALAQETQNPGTVTGSWQLSDEA